MSFLLYVMGHTFWMYERSWNDVTAEVQYGHELHFQTSDGEEHALLHLSPPAGEPAWQDGQKVKLSYYLDQPQFAVFREQRPASWSNTAEVWAFQLLLVGVPLAFLALYRRKRERAARAALPVTPATQARRSVLDWVAYATVGLTLGLAIVCAYVLVCMMIYLLAAIHYMPDANNVVVELLVVSLVCLPGGAALGLISLALYRRDKRRCGLNRE